MKKARGRSGFLAVCIAPAVILFFVFMILPTLNVFRMSLFEKVHIHRMKHLLA